ncbi:polysaccharide ABC transporter, ATP-binding protein [Bifidobacterium actinocoloniiforme DSM 22766]|uniref:Polysaccharide ABC transporter, ATP-binding protein n=1 Tax=Bifidobacterium actinocoloniiforme DSM 22766 TaxID=1437605 RepID=A0A086Z1X9_9BIFI|nr:ABC transporter ATP-binding protein [Bifidobacterium actinocoloniiforme]AKV55624.1 sugar ABC transporter [Bifidobacterium actinocoloniiforme DSM 22766]KFI40529.1 polysaccharide ABC transporter, ATP-binding protein [Bifidobacterium actinocoloniiforme DSM 22766]
MGKVSASTPAENSSPVVLSVEHVDKVFRLPTEQATGLKQAFINWSRGIKGYKEQQVLEDISFQVHRGDFFGIVGRNGSGKSTLLKLISGIYCPERGKISYSGKLVPFIELGVGFNPELTGRENVYLNGALLGFTSEEVDAMYDDIVEFAELGDFMDQKLKNYSSGMQVRLAFSVAIKAQGDILVLDEVLAVGDEAFQRKCDDYFAQVKKDPSKTVILVTHDMSAVKKYCDKAILIQDGHIVVSGDKDDVANRYTLENLKAAKKDARDSKSDKYPTGLNERVPKLRAYPISSPVCSSSDIFRFDVEYQYDEDREFYLAIAMHDTRRGGIVYDTGSNRIKLRQSGHQIAHFEMPLNLFNNGEFRLVASLRTASRERPDAPTEMIAFTNDENSCVFAIRDSRNSEYALLSDRALRIRQVGVSQV